MASLVTDGATFRLAFSVPGQSRRRVRLGSLSPEQAERALYHVEVALRAHKRGMPVAVLTLDWLFRSAPRSLLSALAAAGVVDDRRMLGDALRSWILDRKVGLSSQRADQAERCMDSLLEFLGDLELESITAGQLTRWRDCLADRFAENTVTTYVLDARQFFLWAVGQRLIESSPATELRARYVASERLCEVSAEMVRQLCQATWDVDLLCALVLARWGGLRAAEILRVRVADVDLAAKALTVRDTKRAKSGHATRQVPLFPELDPVRDVARDRREDAGQAGRRGLLLPSLGSRTTSAMDKRAKRLCEAVGVEPWHRFWQNMRATRESELMDAFPLKDVCKWIGNSPAVAMRHYAMVRQESFDRAVGRDVA